MFRSCDEDVCMICSLPLLDRVVQFRYGVAIAGHLPLNENHVMVLCRRCYDVNP
jgi:hypothetical protein